MGDRPRGVRRGRARVAEESADSGTAALTGFQLEIVRRTAGMPSVGTKTLEIMVSGMISGATLPAVSTLLTAAPRKMPTHEAAYCSSSSSNSPKAPRNDHTL